MSQPSHPGYRPDIDGLRAVAVLAVIVFHAFPRLLPGGFAGVDVFFVISGYLISGIIFRALRERRFSYGDFYARRIRRIFPALVTVLGAGLLAGWFLFLPDEYQALGKQTFAGSAFVANLLFWSEAGYFDVAAQVKPLLHLWSLGVEEQFYLTWPLLAVAFHRGGRFNRWIMPLLLAASFAFSLYQTFNDATAAYYSPFTRFWELLLGAWLADVELRAGPLGADPATARRREWTSIAGAALLGASLVLLAVDRQFPGFWALLPTLGALLVIASPGGWFNRVVLSNRLAVFVGLISYPLYLWHWLLLAIVRTRLYVDGAEAPKWQRALVVVASFVLAWLTYVLVEKPIRFGNRSRRVPVALGAAMAGIAGLGVAVHASDGGAFRLPTELRPLARYQFEKELERNHRLYRAEECFIGEGREFESLSRTCVEQEPRGAPLVVLWGDSHAASLYPGLHGLQSNARAPFRLAQFNYASCPPIAQLGEAGRASCRRFNAAALRRIAELKPDVVVMEGDWWYYRESQVFTNRVDAQNLRGTIDALRGMGVAKVVVFGNLPVWDIAAPKIIEKRWVDSGATDERTADHLIKGSLAADADIREFVRDSGAAFFSPVDHLCDESGCLLTARHGEWRPVAWDAAHLTAEGSDLVVSLAKRTVFETL